jgi:transcriptional regulator with XRE-family HTH domain
MAEPSFGRIILDARKQKGYSQSYLAKLLNLDFTYLSKLENDRAPYPPSEAVIQSLTEKLDLPNLNELIYLAGRIPQADEDFLKQNYKEITPVLRRMQEDSTFAQRVFREAKQLEDEEE